MAIVSYFIYPLRKDTTTICTSILPQLYGWFFCCLCTANVNSVLCQWLVLTSIFAATPFTKVAVHPRSDSKGCCLLVLIGFIFRHGFIRKHDRFTHDGFDFSDQGKFACCHETFKVILSQGCWFNAVACQQ